MKAAKMTVAGVTYYLVFDGEAMFALRDIYGGTQLALEAIEPDNRKASRRRALSRRYWQNAASSSGGGSGMTPALSRKRTIFSSR